MDFSFFTDALASGDIIVIGVAALAVAVLVTLKLLGKEIPLLDKIIPAILSALKMFRKPPAPPSVPVVKFEKAEGGVFGKASLEDVAKFEAQMLDAGYTKQADGSWKRD